MRGLFFAKRPVKTVAQRLHKIGERGAGADTLTGGLGDDIFDYNALSEIGDSITDFEVGANGDVMDMIGLPAAVGCGGSDPLGAQQSGADTIVEIDTTGASSYSTVVTLDNITVGDITTDNWIFS